MNGLTGIAAVALGDDFRGLSAREAADLMLRALGDDPRTTAAIAEILRDGSACTCERCSRENAHEVRRRLFLGGDS